MKSAPHIAFDYRPSSSVLAACSGVAILAQIAVFYCGLSWWVKIPLAIAIAGYTTIAIRNYRHPRYHRIIWHSAGHGQLIDNNDHEIEAALVNSARLGPMLVLSWIPFEAACFRAVLMPDNLDAESRRRLRVRLARPTTA